MEMYYLWDLFTYVYCRAFVLLFNAIHNVHFKGTLLRDTDINLISNYMKQFIT